MVRDLSVRRIWVYKHKGKVKSGFERSQMFTLKLDICYSYVPYQSLPPG